MKPLSGMRVIDFSHYLAGPLCGQWLGDFGADVIKVEPPAGDDSRTWPPVTKGAGSLYLASNRNKRSMVLNLKSEEAKPVLASLIKSADVIIENFSARVSSRLGIDWEAVRAVNDRAVHCSISGYGRTGPWSNARAYDPILQAFSGMLLMTGGRDSGPVRTVFAPIDQTAAHHAVIGIMAALMDRGRSGRGAQIEICLLDTALSLQAWNFQSYWMTGVQPARVGTSNRTRVPYEVFDAADGQLFLAVGNEAMWKRFCTAINRPDLLVDPRFRTNDLRIENYDETIAMVAAILREQPQAEWVERFAAAGVPCGPLHSLAEVLAHPQTVARDLVRTSDSSHFGRHGTMATPVLFDGERPSCSEPPPPLGGHTREVLREIGYDDLRIDELVRSGCVSEGSEELAAQAAKVEHQWRQT